MTQDIRTIRIATQGPAGPPGPASRGDVFDAASQTAMLALAASKGDIARRTDLSQSFVLAADDPTVLANWKQLLTPPDAVQSVGGLTGAIGSAALKSALAIAAGDVSGLSASATTDATNAGNIGAGTLPNARLAAVPNSALANSSVTISGHSVSLGGSLSLAAADISGLATSATTDATNAGNISAGTLPDARLSSNVARRDQANTFGDNAISRFSGVASVQTADYALAATDNGTIVYMNKATAVTVTLPNSLPAGFNCVVVQEGAGQVTFAPAGGATKQAPNGAFKTSAQYGSVSLFVKANSGGSAADWRLDGALTA